MSLLHEIQKAAVEGDSDLPTLLRKCKILASKLGNSNFSNWVEHELNGYRNGAELPEYRILTVLSYGHFFGGFGSKLTNAQIPITCIPEKLHEYIRYSHLRSPISTYSMLIKETTEDAIQEQWPSEVLSMLSDKLYQDMNCLQAWKHIPRGAVVALLDTVRNRILSFVLEIESASPEAGEAPINSHPLPQEKVTAIFNTYISGNVQNLASGGQHVQQTADYKDGISPEIFENMLKAITASQLDRQISESISAAIDQMKNSVGKDSFPASYTNFMSMLADHIAVVGPILAPFLPALTQFLQ